MIRFEPLGGLSLGLGESPVWDERRNLVFLCDIPTGRLLAIRLGEGQVDEWVLGTNVCSVGLCESGRLVVSLTREIILFDPETGERQTLAHLEGELETNRLNDGKVGPDGAFWVGTTDQRPERQPVCSLYRIGADGNLVRKKSGLLISNGLAWSPDGTSMYHSDSGGQWIERHDFDAATCEMGEGIRIAAPGEADGRPDGGATDINGFYWSAGVSAGCLNRYSSEGELVDKYPLPVATPTMPCFCGPDLKTLLITSHRYLSPERLQAYPLSGAVLVASSPVAGAPIARMKGF
ncbi:SMP-30/Gluconolaconase/LRE-like region-containing protein [Rhizobium sp. CF080]|uniref:SMP-30/gluconolactonase/LRE family protein n=1 Tax=Rhizobium sp. (strain CF080) TaxID=1144310 RepID=UPI000271AC31|nr:SMP-30/gluconolactonase/LRE family protein [Rhizobium sp. CF080]EUB96636.1 SMP-30/Gluconolaconase/LRE-like region-containing protein [Rhizobium sp. CF080]